MSQDREPEVAALSVAVEAIVSGSTVEDHWNTLVAFCARDGVNTVARALAAKSTPSGHTERWWRVNLLLSTELSAEDALRNSDEVLAVEGHDTSPALDVDRHALEVSTVILYLQTHLARLRAEVATSVDCSAAAMVVRASRVARLRGKAATSNPTSVTDSHASVR